MEEFLEHRTEDELVNQLSELVESRYNRLDFYQELYSREEAEIDSMSDFRQLPVIGKEELEKIPDKDLPVTEDKKAQIIGAHPTSGTTGEAHVLYRSLKDLEVERKDRELMLEESIPQDSRTVVVMAPHLAPRIMNFLRESGRFAVTGDPYELEGAREMIENVEADILYTTPSNALKLGRMMEENGPDPESIKRLITAGEGLTDTTQESLEDIYNAEIAESYGSAETNHMGDQCPELYGTGTYHVNTDNRFFEVVDPETGEICEPGEEGELVVTILYRNTGIPFNRYRTGDLVVAREKKCGCDYSNLMLEVRGRVEFDTIPLKGIHISRREFEEALKHIKAYTTGNYQLHLHESRIDGDTVPRLEVHLEPRKEFTDPKSVEEEVADRLSAAWEITGSHTWDDAVEESLFQPLEVVFDTEVGKGGKTTRVVDHR